MRARKKNKERNDGLFQCQRHAGFALGLDRVAMILCGTDNIRDVEAFPKNLQAVDPMSHAPTPVTAEALDQVGIELKKE